MFSIFVFKKDKYNTIQCLDSIYRLEVEKIIDKFAQINATNVYIYFFLCKQKHKIVKCSNVEVYKLHL